MMRGWPTAKLGLHVVDMRNECKLTLLGTKKIIGKEVARLKWSPTRVQDWHAFPKLPSAWRWDASVGNRQYHHPDLGDPKAVEE